MIGHRSVVPSRRSVLSAAGRDGVEGTKQAELSGCGRSDFDIYEWPSCVGGADRLPAFGEMRHDRTPQQVRGTGSTMVWRQTAFDPDGAGVLNDHRRPAVLGSLHAPIGYGQESGPVHAYDVFTGLWQGHG